jgi:hypothetical protein
MTDKELLHAAAKAAGIDVGGWNSDREALFCDASYFWNPLADDGDALRLAVKLQFGLSIEGPSGKGSVSLSPAVLGR